MRLDAMLSRLDKVTQTSPDSWMALCPAHQDKNKSLSLRQTSEKTLIHCFAGCSPHEVMGAIGLNITDLFPRRTSSGKPERRPFPAIDALRVIAYEALVVAAAASTLQNGGELSAIDRERLSQADSRIQSALSAVIPHIKGGRHE